MPVTPPAHAPEFRFVRTDTTSQEVIQPPGDGGNLTSPKRHSILHRDSNSSSRSGDHELSPPREKRERRLSQRLHLDRRSRSSSATSANVPADLPKIGPDVSNNAQEREAQWEKRATLLVQRRPNSRSSSVGGGDVMVQEFSSNPPQQSRSRSASRVNDPEGDV